MEIFYADITCRDQIRHTAGGNSVNRPDDRRLFAESTIGPLEDEQSETRKRLIQSGAADATKIGELVIALRTWAEADDAWAGFINGEVVLGRVTTQ